MRKLLSVLISCVILTGCAMSLEGTQCPYAIRFGQDRFYNDFRIGENQVIQSKTASGTRVEYNITKEDPDNGGYYISGTFYFNYSAIGSVGVATMDSNWKIIAHVSGNPDYVKFTSSEGCSFSAYINPELYDVSKFRYITFGLHIVPGWRYPEASSYKKHNQEGTK